MSSNAAREAIRSRLAESLAKVELDLFTREGARRFNYAAVTDNLTEIIYRFYTANGRAPSLIFNDGLPAAWKPALESRAVYGINNLISPVTWTSEQAVSGRGEAAYGQTETLLHSRMAFNCKMWARDGASVRYDLLRPGVNGDVYESVTESLQGPYNSRFVFPTPAGPVYVNIPRDQFSGGVFQTWGLLLVVAEHPEFVYATDEGCFLTMQGVAMIERSASYYATRFIRGEQAGAADDAVLYSVLGDGPVMLGIPLQLAEMLRQMEIAAKKESNPVRQLASFALSAAGLFFGASGLSGLIGGQFTIPNLSASVNLASKFGIDTGQLGPSLKVIGALTGGDFSFTTAASSANTGSAIMDDWAAYTGVAGDWGPDPSTLDYGWSEYGWADWTHTLHADGMLPVAELSNEQFFSMLEVDPAQLEITGQLSDAQGAFSDALGDWGPAPEAYDAGAILAEQEDMLSHYMTGYSSVMQYAAAAGVSPAVNAAAQVAMRQGGASPTSTRVAPQQAQQAAQVAQQRAATAPPGESSIWQTAANMLNLYGQYQQIQARNGTGAVPSRVSIPAASSYSSGSLVRQPDGSVTIRRADGSMTTIRPDGQTMTTTSPDALNAFVSRYKWPIIAGGALLAVGGIVYAMSRRR